MKEILTSALTTALQSLNIEATHISLERPAEMKNGDFSTNVALVYAKQLKTNPVAFAVQLVDALKAQESGKGIAGVEKIEVAGPGFINFYLTPTSIKHSLEKIVSHDLSDQKKIAAGKKIAYEYTDPNPFKVFHIGHLMANTVGEALSRLGEYAGADVRRFCYQGDVGRHIALMIWGMRFLDEAYPSESMSISHKVAYLGRAYAAGAQKFYDAEKAAEEKTDDTDEKKLFTTYEGEVQDLNKKIYDRSSEEVNALYDQGKEWSLEHFEELYVLLGTKFDQYFFESQAAIPGVETVKANTAPNGKAIFEESQGAIIFPGEKYGLHTRVFITRFGLPAYEAKEIGLAQLKYAAYPFDTGIFVTANEQDDYFKVVLKATELLFPEIGTKQKHISHGILRLTTGKMSSRKGDVITGESLITDMIDMALERMKERNMSEEQKKKVAAQVGVAAIKYTVLRQATGKDIIFDPEKSLSFEGDSGPYLQYSCVRAISILEKAKKEQISASIDTLSDDLMTQTKVCSLNWAGGKLERLLGRFEEIAEHSFENDAPHHVANYLMELAATFNSFYASTQIVAANDALAPYKVGLVYAFTEVMKKGLWLLGIEVPEKM